MPGALTHSPADVLRRLLISLGVGVLPSPSGSQVWPMYAHNEPDRPDNVITIYDTQGKKNGRTHVDGEVQEHHGFQMRVRSADSKTGYTKARAVYIIMSQTVFRDCLTIEGSVYRVQSITLTTDVVPIGKDASTPTKRSLYTINGLISLRKVDC